MHTAQCQHHCKRNVRLPNRRFQSMSRSTYAHCPVSAPMHAQHHHPCMFDVSTPACVVSAPLHARCQHPARTMSVPLHAQHQHPCMRNVSTSWSSDPMSQQANIRCMAALQHQPNRIQWPSTPNCQVSKLTLGKQHACNTSLETHTASSQKTAPYSRSRA